MSVRSSRGFAIALAVALIATSCSETPATPSAGPSATAAAATASPPAAARPPARDVEGVWRSIGPTPLGNLSRPDTGRVISLAVDPSDRKHWLAGAATGGIWESTDSGKSWTTQTDALPSLAIGALAFAPSDPRIIYAGTGEGNFSRDGYAGVGVLKSIDAGRSWALSGESSFKHAGVGEIRVHPNDPNIVLAITIRGRSGRFSDDVPPQLAPPLGVLRSTDGGVTWVRRLAGQATDLEVNERSFNDQYAAIGSSCRPACQPAAASEDNGVYRSTDGGNAWRRVAGPWISMAPTTGRIELAMARSDPNIVYASIQRPLLPGTTGLTQGVLGLFRTENAWAETPTWIQVPTDATGPLGYCDRQCGSAHSITIDPSDASIVFVGGVDLWRCRDCGSSPSWKNVGTTIHVDHRVLVWEGSQLLDGNDGGVFGTVDRGESWQSYNATISAAQLFSGALHPTNRKFVLTGSKDNACLLWRDGTRWSSTGPPQHGICEGDVALSASRPDTEWMAAADFGQISRTRDGGRSYSAATTGISEPVATFTASVRRCPANEDVFLTGNTRLWRTDNFFSAPQAAWAANGPPNAGPVRGITFAETDLACKTYAFGTANGQIWLTTDGGGSWTNLDPSRALPARTVSTLAFDPRTSNTLYAGFGGFAAATPGRGGHVFKTTNALTASPSWANVSPSQDRPQNVIIVTPQMLYTGSDLGVWRSGDGGATWLHMGPEVGMPNVPVHDLKIHAVTGEVFAFTFGRGVFVLTPRLN